MNLDTQKAWWNLFKFIKSSGKLQVLDKIARNRPFFLLPAFQTKIQIRMNFETLGFLERVERHLNVGIVSGYEKQLSNRRSLFGRPKIRRAVLMFIKRRVRIASTQIEFHSESLNLDLKLENKICVNIIPSNSRRVICLFLLFDYWSSHRFKWTVK